MCMQHAADELKHTDDVFPASEQLGHAHKHAVYVLVLTHITCPLHAAQGAYHMYVAVTPFLDPLMFQLAREANAASMARGKGLESCNEKLEFVWWVKCTMLHTYGETHTKWACKHMQEHLQDCNRWWCMQSLYLNQDSCYLNAILWFWCFCVKVRLLHRLFQVHPLHLDSIRWGHTRYSLQPLIASRACLVLVLAGCGCQTYCARSQWQPLITLCGLPGASSHTRTG